MSLDAWEKKVLKAPGAEKYVREIEDELRLTAALTAPREQSTGRKTGSKTAKPTPTRRSA